jgi:hypothetical protein
MLQHQDAVLDRIETMVSALAGGAHLGWLQTVVRRVEQAVAADAAEAVDAPVVKDHIVDLAGHVAPLAVDWLEYRASRPVFGYRKIDAGNLSEIEFQTDAELH